MLVLAPGRLASQIETDPNFFATLSFFLNPSHQLFNLTAAETLSLINLKPTSDVEIHLLVEDCESRMKDDEIEKLLALAEELL